MAEMQLTPKERQALKARAHGLKPVVLLGAAGLSPSVVREIDRALLAHELIKVKVPVEDRGEREQIFATVAESLSAARVQAIGKLLVLFRPAPETAEPAPEAPRPKGNRHMKTGDRSPKAPARAPASRVAKGPATKPRADRAEVERLHRGAAPRRDPGTARRAAGRSNAPRGGRGK
ncbi:MAG: ribosome assembly RNA-binding protein YhbY [Gammaproteobacteria bacterium]|nr:ribosome assembly RNA-binding protein YhbY [Gammaproteobacteria bacterium]